MPLPPFDPSANPPWMGPTSWEQFNSAMQEKNAGMLPPVSEPLGVNPSPGPGLPLSGVPTSQPQLPEQPVAPDITMSPQAPPPPIPVPKPEKYRVPSVNQANQEYVDLLKETGVGQEALAQGEADLINKSTEINTKEAGIVQASAESAAKEADLYQQEYKRNLEQNTAESAQYLDKINQAQVLANTQVDPNKLWVDASAGQKFAGILGMIMGGFVSSKFGGKNAALEIIDKAVNRNIDAQVQNIQNAQQNVKNGMAMYNLIQSKHDLDGKGRAEMYGLHMASAEKQMMAEISALGPDRVSLEAQSLLQGVQQKRFDNNQAIKEKLVSFDMSNAQARARAVASAAAARARAQAELDKEKRQHGYKLEEIAAQNAPEIAKLTADALKGDKSAKEALAANVLYDSYTGTPDRVVRDPKDAEKTRAAYAAYQAAIKLGLTIKERVSDLGAMPPLAGIKYIGSKEEQTLYSDYQEYLALMLKARSGAQVSDQEYERYSKAYPLHTWIANKHAAEVWQNIVDRNVGEAKDFLHAYSRPTTDVEKAAVGSNEGTTVGLTAASAQNAGTSAEPRALKAKKTIEDTVNRIKSKQAAATGAGPGGAGKIVGYSGFDVGKDLVLDLPEETVNAISDLAELATGVTYHPYSPMQSPVKQDPYAMKIVDDTLNNPNTDPKVKEALLTALYKRGIMAPKGQ